MNGKMNRKKYLTTSLALGFAAAMVCTPVAAMGYLQEPQFHMSGLPETKLATYTINGSVKDRNGKPMSGVDMYLYYDGRDMKMATCSAGGYMIRLWEGFSGELYPKMEGYTFSPERIKITDLNSNKTLNFVGTKIGEEVGMKVAAPVVTTHNAKGQSLTTYASDDVVTVNMTSATVNADINYFISTSDLYYSYFEPLTVKSPDSVKGGTVTIISQATKSKNEDSDLVTTQIVFAPASY